jgi:hypothetical protein
MGGIQQTTKKAFEPKTYFYYPAYGHKYNYTLPSGETKEGVYPRTVVAGVATEDGRILVGEAKCFTGNKKCSPDQFEKKLGRIIAENRALGGKIVFTITVPDDTVAVGKLFVTEVEKVYPKHVSTKKKEAGSAPLSVEVV